MYFYLFTGATNFLNEMAISYFTLHFTTYNAIYA